MSSGRKSSVKISAVFLIAVMLLMACEPAAFALVIDFESLHPGYETSYIQIPNGYMGFNWSNYFRGMTSEYRPGSGYDYGTIGKMCAYTSGHQIISMASADTSKFNFVGAYITAAWLNNEPVTVEGWLSGRRVYSQDITTSPNGPYWFTFNFEDINLLMFKPITESGNHHIVIDNITVTPEPATLLMLGLGCVILRKQRNIK